MKKTISKAAEKRRKSARKKLAKMTLRSKATLQRPALLHRNDTRTPGAVASLAAVTAADHKPFVTLRRVRSKQAESKSPVDVGWIPVTGVHSQSDTVLQGFVDISSMLGPDVTLTESEFFRDRKYKNYTVVLIDRIRGKVVAAAVAASRNAIYEEYVTKCNSVRTDGSYLVAYRP